MNWAASKGKIKQSVVNEFNDASKGMKLPEYSAPEAPKVEDPLKKAKRAALYKIRNKY